jgi:zinc transport system permease protein
VTGMDFITALFSHPFLRYAVIAILLSSIMLGMVGTFVVSKRLTGVSGGIAHAVLGGVGIAYYFGLSPVMGAFVFALFSAVLLGVVKRRAGQRETTVIAALWSVGMAVGIIFMHLTPGYNTDLMTYLFGNILMISGQDIYMVLGVTALLSLVVCVFYRQFVAVSFDEEYASLRGVPVGAVYILLLCLIAVTIVVLMRLTGLIMVIALLTLPPTIAMMFSRYIPRVMVFAAVLAAVFSLSGLYLSYGSNLPAGAVIVALTGLCYLAAMAVRWTVGLWRQRHRR